MIVLELFAGMRSIGKAFERRGHKVCSVDWDAQFQSTLWDWANGVNPMLRADIGKLTKQDVIRFCGGVPDVIWASPDCTSYSVAAISHHRRQDADGNLSPVTEYAKFCDKTNQHVLDLIMELKPKYWFIENPRGGPAQNAIYAGVATVYADILSIRRYTAKTHGYFHEPPKPDVQSTMQKRGFVS